MTDVRDNRRGILAMAIAMAGFNLTDALTKLATEQLPLGETVFLRGLFATAAVAVAVAADGSWRRIRDLATPMLALRLFGEIGSTLFYLMALVHLALPNVSAVFQATPLAMTAAAALFLGETVGPRRWIAIAVGFVGVTIIVRPGLAGFEPASIWVLVSVLFVVVRDISTARLGTRLPTSLVTLATATAVTLLGAALLPFESSVSRVTEWTVPTLGQLVLLATTAAALVTGYVLLIKATQLAETSAIAPYRYTLLVWALFWGALIFHTVPDAPTLIGGAIVVATGLYAFHRERVRRAEREATRTAQ
ncbi:MAG: DMT family transporter [Phyllobacteriaceae bacterium]|nr:DMT family transporter [Phyllobacteriaceae bacterium]